MEERFIIDTNILIYYLDNKIPNGQLPKMNEILRNSFNISTISVIELLGWHKLNNTDKSKMELFLSNANVHFIDYAVQTKAIEIKQKRKTDTPDTIIAATAILNEYTVVTRNESDFSKIDGIKIYNPFESVEG
ncbi:MAG: type II toxin-antitoxin system VapC family toxin [Bacteroidales bacterium]